MVNPGNMARYTWLAALVLLGSDAKAQIVRYVHAEALSGGDGLTWAMAYHTVYHALDEAAGNLSIDQIWVAGGTYTPNRGAGDRNDSFVLVPGVALLGGFAGSETRPDERDPSRNETILSGDFLGDDGPNFTNRSDNALQVLTAANFTKAAILDGFTVRGGNADFDPNDLLGGGGLYSLSATLIIRACTFIDNSAGVNTPSIGGFGGAIFIRSGDVEISDCRFLANRGMNGGALGVRDLGDFPHRVVVRSSEFLNNSAPLQTGGAVWTGSSPFITAGRELSFIDCRFDGNTTHYGGAIVDQNTVHLSIVNCDFISNFATEQAGAIWHTQTAGPDEEPVQIIGCHFIDNAVHFGNGGAILLRAVDSVIESCTFMGNRTALGNGGAIATLPHLPPAQCCAGTLEVYNSVFSGNSAQFSGAIRAHASPFVLVVNSTFSGNSAAFHTGGIGINAGPSLVQNSILWGNELAGDSTTIGAQIINLGQSPVFIDTNILQGFDPQDGSDGGNLNVDPIFIDPAGPDGIIGTEDDDLGLAPASPAIDAGNNENSLPSHITEDVAGNPRIVGGGIDMGAYEYQVPTCAAADLNCDGVVDVLDLLLLLAAWGPCPDAGRGRCPADLSGDTVVDVLDMLILFANWGG